MTNNNSTELVQLYEALMGTGFFKDKNELLLFLTENSNEILVAFNEFQKSLDLRS